MKLKFECLLITSLVLFSMILVGNSDQSDASATPTFPVVSTENVTIPYDGSKVVYLTTNLTAFTFNQSSDGLYLNIYQNNDLQKTFSCPYNGPHSISWPEHTTWNGSGVLVDIINVDLSGRIAFQISLTKNSNVEFTVECYVISYGLIQGFSYNYNIIPVASTTSYTLEFSSPVISAEGIFVSQGTMYAETQDGDKTVVEDISDYSFYAKGLFRGIAIQDDLTIRGRVDSTDDNWQNYQSMTPTIVISKHSADSNIVTHPTINYTFDTTVGSIIFTIQSQSGKSISNESIDKSLSVLSSDPITVTVFDGTEALILFDNNKNVIERYVVSAEDTSFTENLSNQGSGTYVIKFTHPRNSTVFDTVTITVIASLIPSNDIHVTCGPSP